MLGCALTDQQVVLAFDVLRNRFIHLISGDLVRTAMNHTREGDNGDFGGSSADIHNHVSRGLRHGQTCADRRRHRLLDQMSFAGFRTIGRILHRSLFNLGDSRWDSNDDSRMHEYFPAVRLLNEVRQHFFRHRKIRNDTILHWPDGYYVSRRAA